MNQQIKVLFLASEADPFVKVGGLGDVAGSLPVALRSLTSKIDVRLALPFYPSSKIDPKGLKHVAQFAISTKRDNQLADIYQTEKDNLPVALIKGKPIEDTMTLYSSDGYLDEKKYLLFTGCPEIMPVLKMETGCDPRKRLACQPSRLSSEPYSPRG